MKNGRKSPKAMQKTFASGSPTKWFVRITGVAYGRSGAIKKQVYDLVEEMLKYSSLPGLTKMTVTAQQSGNGIEEGEK